MITPGTDRLGYFGLQEGVERQNRAPPRSGLVQRRGLYAECARRPAVARSGRSHSA
jgi:hypothetical protein